MSNLNTPEEVAKYTLEIGIKKAKMATFQTFLLSILAGAFIGFAAYGATAASHDISSYGLAKLVSAIVFGTGLMMVIIGGAELFTGNTLLVIAWREGKITLRQMLRNWSLVYSGNFIGAILMVSLLAFAGVWGNNGGLVGGATIKIAAYKTSYQFFQVVLLGILCNWLVCMAVWMSYSAKDVTGKIIAVFFPIMLFIVSGFEHAIANMYFIPAGILAAGNPELVSLSGLGAEKLSYLTWKGFFLNNLIPATIGNIIGGALAVGMVYRLVYLKGAQKVKPVSLAKEKVA